MSEAREPATGESPTGPAGGLAATVERLARGVASSAGLVDATLERIARAQPTLNAFRLVPEQAARREAAAADRRLAAGERAALLGVPVAVKDDVETAGDDMRFGTHHDVGLTTGDAAVVARLRAAGAVIVGKTTTCEFGQWPFTAGPAFGVTRNPWSLEHSPGGSSGGAAAAVAGGLVPAAVGSDGAGSIRIPAAWTHLVGIKPTAGAVPDRDGPTGFNGLNVNGPLARTVADAALLLDVVADAGDRFRRAARRAPRRLRIGLSLRRPFTGLHMPVHADVAAAARHVAGTLAALGHDVVETDPDYGLIGFSFLPRSLVGIHAWARRSPDPSRLDPRTRTHARIGGLLRGPALASALRAVPSLRRRVGAVFDRVDVLLVPTTATPPLRVGALTDLPGWRTDVRMTAACPYAWPWNTLGWPGISVPAGFSRAGLPLGVQLLGPGGTTATLVSLAAELEAAERWPDRRPPDGPDGRDGQDGRSLATIA